MGNTHCDEESQTDEEIYDERVEIVARNIRRCLREEESACPKTRRKPQNKKRSCKKPPPTCRDQTPCKNKLFCVKHAIQNKAEGEDSESSCSEYCPERKKPKCDSCGPEKRQKVRKCKDERRKDSDNDECSDGDSEPIACCGSAAQQENNDSCCDTDKGASDCSSQRNRIRSRRKSNSIISRVLQFLGLQRSNRRERKEREKSSSSRRSSSSCDDKKYTNREGKNQCDGSGNAVKDSAVNAVADSEACEVSDDAASDSDNNLCENCSCPYCPFRSSKALKLDQILVTPECGLLISQSIREMLCHELETRLQGFEDQVVEEERQFWATYIPRDKCPRCCSGQQCDLHGSLGCAACFQQPRKKR